MNKHLTMILGERRYRVERPWGVLPPGMRFRGLSSVAVNARGDVFAAQRRGHPIVVFDSSGRFMRAWGDEHLFDAHTMYITDDDRMFVVDRDAHQVLQFNAEGVLVARLGTEHAPSFQAPFNHPTGVAVARDGEIYVSDGYGNHCVHRFSPDGKLKQTWGRRGLGPGEFAIPHAVWVDRSDRVLVLDRDNDRVQIFRRNGEYVGEWVGFHRPMTIVEDDRGMILISDLTPSLSMFTPDGVIVGRCRPVLLNIGHGICVGPSGDIYIAEMDSSHIVRLAPYE